jgi:hypothetical protein
MGWEDVPSFAVLEGYVKSSLRRPASRGCAANGRYRYVRGADEGGPFEIGNQVAGLKPPQAALVKAMLVSGFQVFEDILARSE